MADELEIEAALERRRAEVAATWEGRDEVVLIGAGELILRPGRDDLAYRFDAHSDYFYLTDCNLPGGVLAFDPAAGWVDFRSPVTVEDRLWSGASENDGHGPTTDQLPDWLAARSSRTVAWLGSPPAGAQVDPGLAQDLRFGLAAVRRPKDAIELARMRAANEATAAAFRAALPLLREGVSEREVQIELEAEAFRHGSESMGYDTIIGGGVNSAVLHFAPSSRRFGPGEMVLIDAGAQHLGYVSDVTRTYPVGGTMTSLQAEIHAIVRAAELAAIEHCRPGVEWRDVHLVAALVIAEGLAGTGLLKGDPATLVESGAAWLFFPHGIGHLVGLGVRDAGGVPLRERHDEPKPYPNLRINLPLEPGFVVTVEPGVYFVPAILGDPANRARYADAVDWERVDQLLDFGGVRIEDDVLITQDGHSVLTTDVPLLA
jgi:Xaa-Pro aminopeptidase